MNIKINKAVAEAAMLIGMLMAVFAEGVCAFAESREDIANDVFRLHILANSDSDEDQALKLKVRNAILEESGEIFGSAVSGAEAAAIAKENLDKFTEIAKEVIAENNCNYSVKCEVADVYFDERTYGTATLPEGEYRALRIIIGEGDGHNWWCVMFPTLCLPAVTNTDEVLENALNDGSLTAEEIELIKNPENYEVRFYFLDLFSRLKG
ncbi:MAG: stage II sporulation protein R [Oscillospiraceae bacterium]|nr:stage II sporulation protein R [Oscillospiraceae bacterium]